MYHMKGEAEVEIMLCYANRCLPLLIERQKLEYGFQEL